MLHNQCFYSVSVNTSIYQSSSAAVFILAVFLLGESITIVKVSYYMHDTICIRFISILHIFMLATIVYDTNRSYIG